MERLSLVCRIAVLSIALPVLQTVCASSLVGAGETKSGWQTEWEQTLAAAKKEGRVAIAGPPQAAERGVLMQFQKTYPDIKLEYAGFISTEFFTRIRPERDARIHAWDLHIGGLGAATYKVLSEGWFQPIRPRLIFPEVTDDSKWLGGFDAGFADNKRTYVFAFASYLTYLVKVNRKVVPESELGSVSGILDPKWKGKIVVFDPRTGGAGALAMAALRQELGDEAIRKILIDQQPVFSSDKRQVAEWVIRGRYPIGIGVADAYLTPFLDEGVGKEVESVKSKVVPISPGSGGLIVMNPAPHPNATTVFVNWLLSRETQAAWAKEGRTNSRRVDVPPGNPEAVPDRARLSQYFDANSEEGSRFFGEIVTLAQRLIK